MRSKTGLMLITATSIHFLKADGKPGYGRRSSPYLIVRSTPVLMQAQVQSMGDAHKDEMYAALEPETRDPDGAITRTKVWLVASSRGPPENHAANDSATPTGRQDTLPGMTRVGRDCTPRDRAVLLDAAARRRAWADELLTIFCGRAARAGCGRRPAR